MVRKKHIAEAILTKLRQADVLTGCDESMVEACQSLAVRVQPNFERRKESGGLHIDQASSRVNEVSKVSRRANR